MIIIKCNKVKTNCNKVKIGKCVLSSSIKHVFVLYEQNNTDQKICFVYFQ